MSLPAPTPLPPTGLEAFTERLIQQGKLTPQELTQAQSISTEKGLRLPLMLVRLGFVSESAVAEAQASAMHLASLKDEDFPDFPLDISKLSLKFMKTAAVLPLAETDDQIMLAMADATDTFSIEAVQLACHKPVVPRVATFTQIDNAISRYYGDGQSALDSIVDEIESDTPANETESIAKLRDLAGEAPIIRLVNLIINHAIEYRASDIHIEPYENRLKVRYRIDGVLQDTDAPPAKSTAAVISRIKIMAKMNIAERRLPQDGRIQIRSQGKVIDLRVSTVPTLHGESLVLRILDKQRVPLDLNALGFDDNSAGQLQRILALPHGIILVTGPTGSGKTTTLYAALQKLNTPEKKILTVEDPVEYQLEGINQIQVKPQIGLNFAEALRSIVRQDPDVIMIGEMRDIETARIAVQSALTGHLVFSTLHTNNAGSSITRLMDMGVEDYLITSTLNGILSQRLVRLLCTYCREVFKPDAALVEELQLLKYAASDQPRLYRATGCKHCAQTGYYGRTIIIELLVLSEAIRRLILAHADGGELERIARQEGMLTMKENGFKKALCGLTTLEEVMRVTHDA